MSCSKKVLKYHSNDEQRTYLALITYTFNDREQVDVTDAYLKNAYIPALKKNGIGPIGVFKNKALELDTIWKSYVLIPFASLDQYFNIHETLGSDEVHLKHGANYINAHYDHPSYLRMESTLLRAFSEMPMLHPSPLIGNRDQRVYELRSYESASEKLFQNKVEMFNAGGEVKLFEELGFNAVFYGEVILGSKMPNLMYMTTFSDQQSRDQHWENFFESPKWIALKGEEKYSNNVSHIDIMFLVPTSYSDY